jgi:cytochrome c-type biogenesis protein CcmH/NrfG
LKKEGYIVICLAALIAAAAYFAPRSSSEDKATAHVHTDVPAGEADSLELMVQEAVALMQEGGPPMQAIGLLRKVVEIEPDQASANFYLGYYSIMSGQYEKAVGRLQTVLRVYPDNSDAHFLMAQAQNGIGDREKAITFLNTCLELGPTQETKRGAEILLAELSN